MENAKNVIRDVIQDVLRDFTGLPKTKNGKKIHQQLASALNNAGFDADKEDSAGFMPSRVPVWRAKDGHQEIESTARRRLIDIVVKSQSRVAALIEIESDLDDLRETGVSTRSGHYDVFSISQQAGGKYFHSYKSLERMATAAFYYAAAATAETRSLHLITETLSTLKSDSSKEHNPLALPLFLVTGRARESDVRILSNRLNVLGAELLFPRT